MVIPGIDTQSCYLPDPSMLRWQSSGEHMIKSSKDREEVQGEVYGDYMELDNHAREISYHYQSIADCLSQPWSYPQVELIGTQYPYTHQGVQQYTKESTPWTANLARLNNISSGGFSRHARRSGSVSSEPARMVPASRSRTATPSRDFSPTSTRLSLPQFTPGPMERSVQGGQSGQSEAMLYCCEPGCKVTFQGSYAKGNLARHRRLKHGGSMHQFGPEYRCDEPGCSKSYRRQDARLKHYRKAHRHLAPGPALARSKHRSV